MKIISYPEWERLGKASYKCQGRKLIRHGEQYVCAENEEPYISYEGITYIIRHGSPTKDMIIKKGLW